MGRADLEMQDFGLQRAFQIMHGNCKPLPFTNALFTLVTSLVEFNSAMGLQSAGSRNPALIISLELFYTHVVGSGEEIGCMVAVTADVRTSKIGVSSREDDVK